jgi:hypothetical protein
MRILFWGCWLILFAGLAKDARASSITPGLPTSIPSWSSYTVTAIANGVNGCANANGCWQVNGALGANKTAGLTQSVTLAQLAANGYVLAYRVKSLTACTGTTTLLTGLGTSSTPSLYSVSAVTGYNLQSAVSNTNLTTLLPVAMGSDTTSAVNLVASVISTVANIDQVAAGCSFAVSVLSAVLP